MSNRNLIFALQTLRPGAEWHLVGSDITKLEWLDTVQARPSNAEIASAMAAYIPMPSLKEQVALLQTQVKQLLVAQGGK